MKNKNVQIQEDKKDIEKRLRLSNEERWKSYSDTERKAIIEKYFELRSADHLGLDHILEDNRQFRANLAFLILGLMLGICGNIIAAIFIKYEPGNIIIDTMIVIAFAGLIWWLVRQFYVSSAEHLAYYDVLEKLEELVKRDQPNN